MTRHTNPLQEKTEFTFSGFSFFIRKMREVGAMASRVPPSSVIQLHLRHITPSLRVKLAPIHPTVLTDMCSLEGPAGYPEMYKTMAWS